MDRFIVVSHPDGARCTTYDVIDTSRPANEQPAVIHSWSDAFTLNASYLAHDFCFRHNAKEK